MIKYYYNQLFYINQYLIGIFSFIIISTFKIVTIKNKINILALPKLDIYASLLLEALRPFFGLLSFVYFLSFPL